MSRRVRDPLAARRRLLESPECEACGAQASEAHHVVPRSAGGDDVVENFLALCLDCHRAWHGAGDPQRRDMIARAVRRRFDVASYVVRKLGEGPGRSFLRRRYPEASPMAEADRGARRGA